MKTKAIKNIKVGDFVRAYNHKEDQIVSSKVTEIFKHKNVSGNKVIVNDKFIATGNHPVHLNGKYKPVSQAKVGDIIIDSDGMETKIHTLKIQPMSIDVYNIEVEGEHNYFAGNILNHNKFGDYEGNDDAMERTLEDIQASAKNYGNTVASIMELYYNTIQSAVGVPTTDSATEPFSIMNDEGTYENWTPGATTTGGETTGGVGWQESYGGGKTTWGQAVSDYGTAKDSYDIEVGKAATKMIAAEDALTEAGTDVSSSLESAGSTIATQAKSGMEDVRASSAVGGFAATGMEGVMKKELRQAAGTTWGEATATAESNLGSALSSYAKVMGDEEESMVVGSEGAQVNIGSISQDLALSAEALQSAGGDLQAAYTDINQNILKTQASTLKTDLLGLESSFYSNVSNSYGGDAGLYIASKEDISKDIKNQIGYYVTGSATTDWDINTGAGEDYFAGYGYSPIGPGLDISYDTTTDGTDNETIDTGIDTGSGGGFLGVNFFWLGGECLEGNVRIVMGDKNGSN